MNRVQAREGSFVMKLWRRYHVICFHVIQIYKTDHVLYKYYHSAVDSVHFIITYVNSSVYGLYACMLYCIMFSS